MKKIFLSLSLILSVLLVANAQPQSTKFLDSKVEEVTLYINGAQITRLANVNLEEGTTKLVIKNLPNTIDAFTYTVEGKGNFTILSITDGYSNSPGDLPKEEQQLKDRLTLVLAQKEDLELEQTILKEEENFLNLNRSIGGQNEGISATDFKQMHELYKTNFARVKKDQLANKRKITELNLEIEQLKRQLYPFSADRVALNQELTITVLAKNPVKGSLRISYFTHSTGWEPSYDVRTSNPGQPIDLILKATVNNHTGENWDNVLLSFSTGKPTAGGTPPTLHPWFLRQIQPPMPVAMAMGTTNRKQMNQVQFVDAEEEFFIVDDIAETGADYSQRQESMLATTYSIPIKYSLPTGKDPLTVEIDKRTFNADYEYTMIPKLSNHVFLTAKVPNSDGESLLNASASIYLGGTYTGTAYISQKMASDTITLPLGVETGIRAERVKVKDYSAKKIVGGKVTETIGWEITLTNLRSTSANYNLKDQVPISTDKNIQIKAKELSGGKLNEENGIITWKGDLQAGKTQKLRFSYEVTYPKDMILYLE